MEADMAQNGEKGKSNIDIINEMPPEHRSDIRPADKRQPARLSAKERAEFRKCEQTIERAIDGFVAMGHALRTIRAQKLYREHFHTFRGYVNARWAFKASRARQIIGGSEVYDAVKGVTSVTPSNEAQVRDLVPHPVEIQRTVWKMSVERFGTPTQTNVREVLDEVLGQRPETPQRIEDKRHLFQEVCSRLDQCARWIDENDNPENVPDEARRYFQNLLGAVRDWLRR